jgi:hypothetical protein
MADNEVKQNCQSDQHGIEVEFNQLTISEKS